MEFKALPELVIDEVITQEESAEYFSREAEDVRFEALERRIEELERLMADQEEPISELIIY